MELTGSDLAQVLAIQQAQQAEAQRGVAEQAASPVKECGLFLQPVLFILSR